MRWRVRLYAYTWRPRTSRHDLVLIDEWRSTRVNMRMDAEVGRKAKPWFYQDATSVRVQVHTREEMVMEGYFDYLLLGGTRMVLTGWHERARTSDGVVLICSMPEST